MHTSPWMTPELDTFRDAVRRFIETEVVPHEERWRKQQHVDRELWRKAGELGILLADIPEEYGGSGGNFAHQNARVQRIYGGANEIMKETIARAL